MCNIRISLAAARTNAKMTQAEAARAINVAKNTLWSWESGQKEIPKAAAMALASLYEIPLDALILPEYSAKS